MNSKVQVIWKLSTMCILAVNHFFLFQPNAHNMMSMYIYHQLPPTCFGVCYTILWETIVSLAQKPYACCKKHYLAKNYMLYEKKNYLLKNCMLVAKRITCSKTLCFMKKALLAQKLYACCKKCYLLKNSMLYEKSITCSKTVCLLQKAVLAQKLYALCKKHY